MLLLFFSLLLQSVSGIQYLQEPSDQSTNSRSFSNQIEFQEAESIRMDSLFNAGIIKTFDESVYILEYSPHPVVKKVDLHSKSVIQKFGNGRGRGPGELINPTDFGITEDGKVWIADEPQSRISIFENDGTLYDDWVIQFTPYKVTGFNNYLAIWSTFDPIMKLVDNAQNIVWSSDYMIKNPKRWANLLVGFILSDQNMIYKISNYAGTITAYNDEGEMKYFKNQIDSDQRVQGKPISGLDYLSYQLDRSKLIYAVASGCIIGDEIHLLVQQYGNNPTQVIDVYNTANTEYLYSYRLSTSIRSIAALKDGTLIGLKPDHLLLWKKK